MPICSHGIQESNISLVVTLRYACWIEVDGFLVDRYPNRPLIVNKERTVTASSPRLGVKFDGVKLVPQVVFE
jgi:hypothetical protein